MSTQEHAFIVGGGPAGLVAAIALRRKGLRVTVADGGEAPSDKACGEGILPEGLSALERLGICLDGREGRTFRGIRFLNHCISAEATFPLRCGLGIRRILLHRQLARAAENAGAQLLWSAPVTNLTSNHVTLGTNEISADWIIGADGIRSRVNSWAGLNCSRAISMRYAFRQHFLSAPWTDFVEVHWSARAQLYITPVSNSEVGVVVLSQNPRLRVSEALRHFPDVSAKLAGAEIITTERGAVTGNSRLSAVYRGKIALIGDASGTVDAITGEGMSLAFLQAEALANAVAEGDLAKYGVTHARLRRRAAFMARMLLLLEKHPHLQERTLRILSADPDIFRQMLAAHVGHTSPFSLAGAGARFGWRFLAA